VGAGYNSGVRTLSHLMASSASSPNPQRDQPDCSTFGGGAEVSRKRGCTASTRTTGLFYQPNVCCPQKRGKMETNYRSLVPKLLPGATPFQDGGSLHVTYHSEISMANGQDRSQGCLPDYTSDPGV